MAEAALILGLITMSFTVGQNTATTVKFFESLHHHTTRAMYRHVLKPVGKAIKGD
jgi:hypothetical protein